MIDLDRELSDYGEQWRAQQPALRSDVLATRSETRRPRSLLVAASVVFVLVIGAAAFLVTRSTTSPTVRSPGASTPASTNAPSSTTHAREAPAGWREIRLPTEGVSLAVPEHWAQAPSVSTSEAHGVLTVSSATEGTGDLPIKRCGSATDPALPPQTWITLYEYPTTVSTSSLADPIEGSMGQPLVHVVPRPMDFTTTNEASDGAHACPGGHGFQDQFFTDAGRTFVARTVYYGPAVTQEAVTTARQVLNTLQIEPLVSQPSRNR